VFENFQICPYTGLRSFTEEESIYFKGRDEHIQEATTQLQRNKFLMLTGASGDGKSSLVYAGIIPTARAGFLKSTYTQWSVVDFRPERSPFQNFCQSVAKQLEIESVNTVEAELSHGFSALIDLYKNSIRYVDPDSQEWINANDEERAAIKRRASNLIILADQFEEFFTNPENYYRGVPSKESYLVINLLLETAKIALEEGLPIYIVFTMRSDYIGQCTVFRGLPEYIGFSQFFVPRLNRKELQEVIEKPADLSGNTISRRLTERLIHDITEGVDQLPILQHALNQIWVAANNGEEEMDLLHYAMVGGLDPKELPNGDQQRFKEWFAQLPQYIKACYHQPSLRNVLDTHANKLYEMAADYYLGKTGSLIDKQEAKNIIKIIFTCLTKIDQSRAVRNRMTLTEIQQIMENHHVKIETLADVLNIFREPGNTLIRPFINEGEKNTLLNYDEVLDITHESLIRNWELLKVWAKEEYSQYTTYQDFYQQVVRWIKHDRSRGFLLPIGPLTYFEKWFKDLNPTPYWIKRYLETGNDSETLGKATETLNNSREFLSLSAKKHAITRAVVRVGPRKIIATLAIVTLVILSSFYYRDSVKKRNDVVIETIKQDAESLLESKHSTLLWQTYYLIGAEKHEPGYLRKALDKLTSDVEKVKISTAIGVNTFGMNRNKNFYLAEQMLWYADSISNVMKRNVASYDLKKLLSIEVEFASFLDYYNVVLQKKEVTELQKQHNHFIADLVLKVLADDSRSDWDMKELNEAIESALSHGAFSESQINQLINQLSPLEGNVSPHISNLFAREKTLTLGLNQSKLTYNGLYQLLAYLYASQGDVDKTWTCVKRLFDDHPGYETFRPDALTVSAYFIVTNNWETLDQYLVKLSNHLNVSKLSSYQRVAERFGIMEAQYLVFKGTINPLNQDLWFNPALQYIPESQMNDFMNKFIEQINLASNNQDLYHYQLANFYKLYATKKILFKKKDEDISVALSELYSKSWNHYQKVGNTYLQEEIESYLVLAETTTREMIYLYPDYREKDFVSPPRYVDIRLYSEDYIKYLLDNNLFSNTYNSIGKMNLVQYWIKQYLWTYESPFWNEIDEINYEFWVQLEQELRNHPSSNLFDFNALEIILANAALNNEAHEKAAEWALKISNSDLKNLFTQSGSGSFILSILSFEFLTKVYGELCASGQVDAANHIISGVNKLDNKVRLYTSASIKLFEANQPDQGKLFLDSAILTFDQIPTIGSNFYDIRKDLAYAMTLNAGQANLNDVRDLTRNMNSGIGLFTGALVARALSYHDELYIAYNSLPLYASTDSRLNYAGNILMMQANSEDRDRWKEIDENYQWLLSHSGYTP